MDLDFSHSELLPVGRQLSPYYTVRFTGFSKNRPLADSFIEKQCQFMYYSVPFS